MIPIVINNRNRLTTTKKLVDNLINLGHYNITIIDNDSSYPPLLEWYEKQRRNKNVIIIKLNTNSGQLALWNEGIINQFENYPWIAYTDSDIELNEYVPNYFLTMMCSIGEANGYNKVGLGLRIDDLPDTGFCKGIINHENQFWINELSSNIYQADVDTTFSVIRPECSFQYKALRLTDPIYLIRHMPWYNDWNNLSEEERYVLDHADNKFSTTKGRVMEMNKG